MYVMAHMGELFLVLLLLFSFGVALTSSAMNINTLDLIKDISMDYQECVTTPHNRFNLYEEKNSAKTHIGSFVWFQLVLI